MAINQEKVVFFGQYYINGDAKKEPIEWLALTEKSDKVLLISKYVLDAKAYDNPEMPELIKRAQERMRTNPNRPSNSVYWCECTLHRWLNNDFYEAAFSQSDKNAIIKTNIETYNSVRVNRVNPFDNSIEVEGGPAVTDNVFCLSIEEVEEYFNVVRQVPVAEINPLMVGKVGQDAVVELSDTTTTGTPYADSQNLYYTNGKNTPWWWLRSPGGTHHMAAVMHSSRFLYKPGESGDDDTIGVRPAIWVKKEILKG